MTQYQWLIYPQSKELFTDIGANLGYDISTTDGSLVAADGWNVTDYISLNGETFNTISSIANSKVAFYDADKKYISQYGAGGDWEADVPPTTKYIRLGSAVEYWDAISAYSNGARNIVKPIHDDKLSIKASYENDTKAMRHKLNGKLKFVYIDFDYIMSLDQDCEFHVVLQTSINHGEFKDYWEGYFCITDFTIDYDDKIIEVEVQPNDTYARLIDMYENEYNLTDLNPHTDNIYYGLSTMIQLWCIGESSVSNIINGMSWDASCQSDDYTTVDSLNKVGMYFNSRSLSFYLKDTSGVYTGLYKLDPTTLPSIGGEYKCWNDAKTAYIKIKIGGLFGGNAKIVFMKADDTELAGWIDVDVYNTTSGDFKFNSRYYGVFSLVTTYLRYLYYKSNPKSGAANILKSDDGFIDYTTTNYNLWVHPQSDTELKATRLPVTTCSNYSRSATKWGRIDSDIEEYLGGNRLYFMEPDQKHNWIPVAQGHWTTQSFWVDAEDVYSKPYAYTSGWAEIKLRDAYSIWEVIRILLKRIDRRLQFDTTVDFSECFFASSFGGSYGRYYRNLYITQLTNISRGEYERAALNTKITLKSILDMLKSLFNVYWYVDDDFNFHLENIAWFENGGQYSTPINGREVGIDITNMANFRNNLRWSYGQNKVKYSKDKMAARFQFEWGLGAMPVFNGYPIDAISNSVERSKTEDVSVNSFVADIDYILANPGDFGNDGWALMNCDSLGNTKHGTVDWNHGQTYVQNYDLSFPILQTRFLLYDMPSSQLRIGDSIVNAKSIARNRTQEVTIPLGDEDIDELKLVKTAMGDGEVYEYELNLDSRSIKLTLKLPTLGLTSNGTTTPTESTGGHFGGHR